MHASGLTLLRAFAVLIQSYPVIGESRREGNQHFSSKSYDDAIASYSTAIKLDPSNHVYFSNRSACYAAKKDFPASAQDALQCVKLAPGFIKGYYRLVQAQMEMRDFDGAMQTAKAGLALDADNVELHKQMRLIKAKKAAVAARDKRGPAVARPANEAALKEQLELGDQLNACKRELRETEAYLQRAVREQKMSDLAKAQILDIEDGTGMYKGVGKIFMRSTKENVIDWMDKSKVKHKEDEGKYKSKMEYLEKKGQSIIKNLEELSKA